MTAPDRYEHLRELNRQRAAEARRRMPGRFWASVERSDQCWLWKGDVYPNGYGHFKIRINGKVKNFYAHRIAYELTKGKIPTGLQIDHLCRVRACVNPAHLEAVTGSVNLRRAGIEPPMAAVNRAKTHCRNGHLLDEANTARDSEGYRRCRECSRLATARHRAKGVAS